MRVENYDKIRKKFSMLYLIASDEEIPLVENLLEQYNIEKLYDRMYKILDKYNVPKKEYFDLESDISELIADAYCSSLVDLACSDVKVVY